MIKQSPDLVVMTGSPVFIFLSELCIKSSQILIYVKLKERMNLRRAPGLSRDGWAWFFFDRLKTREILIYESMYTLFCNFPGPRRDDAWSGTLFLTI